MTNQHKTLETCESIGFIFPCYYQGIPNIVKRFIENLDLTQNKNAYYFTIVTCGRSPGNCIAQINNILQSKGVTLHYGNIIKMFPNYVALYKMAKNADERAMVSEKDVLKIVDEISKKENNAIPKENPILNIIYKIMSNSYGKKGKEFNVSDNCNGCKNCVNLCPVNNIIMQNNKPLFGIQCEQCMACIQWCPKQAINFKSKTQTRGRYHHPNITYQDMIKEKV
jgi:ferredoxin